MQTEELRRRSRWLMRVMEWDDARARYPNIWHEGMPRQVLAFDRVASRLRLGDLIATYYPASQRHPERSEKYLGISRVAGLRLADTAEFAWIDLETAHRFQPPLDLRQQPRRVFLCCDPGWPAPEVALFQQVFDAAVAAGWEPAELDQLPPSAEPVADAAPSVTAKPKTIIEIAEPKNQVTKTPSPATPTGRLFAGVDYSGDMRDPREATWLAIVELREPKLAVFRLEPTGRHGLQGYLRDPDQALMNVEAIGLDFPFGLPIAFAETLLGGPFPEEGWWALAKRMEKLSRPDYLIAVQDFRDTQGEAKRLTDERYEAFSPLHRVNPDLGPMTYHGIRMIARGAFALRGEAVRDCPGQDVARGLSRCAGQKARPAPVDGRPARAAATDPRRAGRSRLPADRAGRAHREALRQSARRAGRPDRRAPGRGGGDDRRGGANTRGARSRGRRAGASRRLDLRPAGSCLRPTPALVVGLALVLCIACGETASPPTPAAETSEFLNLDPSVAYTGMQSCRSCHLGVFATYARTGMARSFHPTTAGGVAAVDPPPEDPGLNHVVGSGNHVRNFLRADGATLSRSEICWYAEGPGWESCAEDFPGNAHLRGDLAADCLFCHTAARRPGDAALARGIDCERCHGPGQLHVERWKATPDAGKGERDPTIVNPRRLPLDERMAVCLQCHLGDAQATARVPRDGVRPESFRPGRPLSDLVIAFRVAEPSQARFGAPSQGDRLVLSQCYQQSEGGLDCMTCHNPHVTVYHEERPPDLFRRQCVRCHAVEACAADTEERQQTNPPDDCVACHMRRAEPQDLRLTAFTDHWIRRRIDIDDSDDEDVRTSPVLEPVFPEDLQGLSADELESYRARAERMLAD